MGVSYGTWRCKACFIAVQDPNLGALAGRSKLGECQGLPKCFRPLLSDWTGHKLIAILQSNGVPL
eukprot:698349-Alexandrium_andersonii.AAC.1